MAEQSTKIDESLLSILICPVARTLLIQAGDWLYSTDPETRRKYPVRDGIPIMLIDESQIAEPEEFDRVLSSAADRGHNNDETAKDGSGRQRSEHLSHQTAIP